MATVELTAKFVEASFSHTAGTRTEFFDTKVRGLALRVSFTGAKSWSLLYSQSGKKTRYTIGKYPTIQLSKARELAQHLLLEARVGADPTLSRRSQKSGHSSENLVAAYLDRHAKRHKKTWKVDERLLLKEFLPEFKGRKVQEIQRREIIDLIEGIVSRAPIQANRVFALLRRMFNFAIEQDMLEHSPCARIKMPSKENRRDRVLSPIEIRSLWVATESSDSSICAIVRLILLSAQRGGEIKRAEWADIDFEGGWWNFPSDRTKNGQPNRVPLTPMIRGVLESLSKTSSFIFPGDTSAGHVTYIHKHLYRLTDKYHLDFVPHDIRRTATTMMASIGISREITKKILNHMDSDVTSIYDRYSYDKEVLEAFTKWEMQLQMILSGKSVSVNAG